MIQENSRVEGCRTVLYQVGHSAVGREYYLFKSIENLPYASMQPKVRKFKSFTVTRK